MSYKEVYEELSLLGEGGMGKVYLVRHRRLGVLRAMKGSERTMRPNCPPRWIY